MDDTRQESRLHRGKSVHTDDGSKIPGERHRDPWSSVLENLDLDLTGWTVEVDDDFECPSSAVERRVGSELEKLPAMLLRFHTVVRSCQQDV